LLAVRELSAGEPGESETARKAAIVQAVDRVATKLNNTRAVCRKYYVHPAVFESYLGGTLAAKLKSNGRSPTGLEPDEVGVVSLLRHAAEA